jgi:hypothetical protein
MCVCVCKKVKYLYIYNLFDSYRKTFSNLFLESRYISITASLYLQVNCAIEVCDLSNINISYR